MGDSDEDYSDRRRRDKFARERNDNYGDRRQQSYGSRGASGVGSGDHGGDRRGGYQRQEEPQPKRSRREWGPEYDTYDPQPKSQQSSQQQQQSAIGVVGGASSSPAILMTFKQFLATQDDSISDEEAISKYQEYKLEFKRQELHKFFVAHKDEEWFKRKYHPEESDTVKTQHLDNVKRRLDIFQELQEKGWIDKASLDHTNARFIIKVMDALVIRLEGGTDEDVALLDNADPDDLGEFELVQVGQAAADEEKTKDNKRKSADEAKKEKSDDSNMPLKKQKRTAIAGGESPKTDGEAADEDHGDGLSDAQQMNSEEQTTKEEAEVGDEEEEQEEEKPTADDGGIAADSEAERKENGGVSAEDGALSDSEESGTQPPLPEQQPQQARGKSRITGPDEDRLGRPQTYLHKTSSIFLRNISPAITISELETVCKRFPGYLRVGLAEPLPERKFYRRGWATFRREVNIKDICWKLNGIRLRECDMGAIVNRDLTRRVRTVNGITNHRQVAQNDLRLAAQLSQIYDKKFGLYTESIDTSGAEYDRENDEFELPPGARMDAGLDSNNPLLQNLTDYLIEEASAEEEELLGHADVAEGQENKTQLEKDEGLLKVLDRIIVYLRLVHSVDFYNHGEYPHEDEMPNRCGLIHVRGPPPKHEFGKDERTGKPLVPISFVNEFTKGFETRLKPMIVAEDKLSEVDVAKLGKKDPEKEVEAFVTANCQELAKDKWLCPLSGKKFKGPEFVRKHIFTKHVEKLEEVRVEVAYFNNYVYDPKRPTNPELKAPNQSPAPLGPPPIMMGAPMPSIMPPRYGMNEGLPPPPMPHMLVAPPPVVPPQWAGTGGGSVGGGGGRLPQQYGSAGGVGWQSGGGGGGSYQQRSYGGGGGGGGNMRLSQGGGYQRRDNYGGGGGRGGGYQGAGRQQWGDHGGGGGRRGGGEGRQQVKYEDLDAPQDVY